MTSQPGKQTIPMHILPNISRSKDNKALKFGQFFLKNHTQNVVEELFPGFFLKIKIEHNSGSVV